MVNGPAKMKRFHPKRNISSKELFVEFYQVLVWSKDKTLVLDDSNSLSHGGYSDPQRERDPETRTEKFKNRAA